MGSRLCRLLRSVSDTQKADTRVTGDIQEDTYMKVLDRAAIPLVIAAVITLVCIMGFRADFDGSTQGCEKARTESAIDQVNDPCDSFITRALLAAENG
jgi:hypothetical protein